MEERFKLEHTKLYPTNRTHTEVARKFYGVQDPPPLVPDPHPYVATGYRQTDDIVAYVTRMIRYPEKFPILYQAKRLKMEKGVILQGPPGTGKTWIMGEVEKECSRGMKISFFDVKHATILCGDAETNLQLLFDAASRLSPSLLFIDEVDALLLDTRFPHLARTLQMLIEGVNSLDSVFTVVATNFPESICPALRRSGRLETVFELILPDKGGRVQILTHMMATWRIAKQAIPDIAAKTDGFTPADLASLCRRSSLKALERQNPVLQCHDSSKWINVDEDIGASYEDLKSTALQMKEEKDSSISRPGDDFYT